jgi:hypothetical protein
MSEHHTQLTWTQIIGMLLLGVCAWAILIGIGYVVIADNSFPGLVIAVTGLIGGYIIYRWLIFIGQPKE